MDTKADNISVYIPRVKNFFKENYCTIDGDMFPFLLFCCALSVMCDGRSVPHTDDLSATTSASDEVKRKSFLTLFADNTLNILR